MRRVFIAAVLSLLFPSCASERESNQCPIGRWHASDVDLSDATIAGGPYHLVEHVYEFKRDGTFSSEGTYRRKGAIEEHANHGTYLVAGDKLELSFEGTAKPMIASFRCDDPKLILVDQQTGAVVEMTRARNGNAI